MYLLWVFLLKLKQVLLQGEFIQWYKLKKKERERKFHELFQFQVQFDLEPKELSRIYFLTFKNYGQLRYSSYWGFWKPRSGFDDNKRLPSGVCFFYFLVTLRGVQDLTSPGIKPTPPAVEACCPNHWTIRERSPLEFFLIDFCKQP